MPCTVGMLPLVGVASSFDKASFPGEPLLMCYLPCHPTGIPTLVAITLNKVEQVSPCILFAHVTSTSCNYVTPGCSPTQIQRWLYSSAHMHISYQASYANSRCFTVFKTMVSTVIIISLECWLLWDFCFWGVCLPELQQSEVVLCTLR